MTNDPTTNCSPWWRHGHVWMVVAGPAAVIAAGAVTVFLAIDGADTLVEADYYRRGVEINKTLAARDKANLPALQGRNHAVTPTRP